MLLCLPQTPLLFMGQEWAASSPFQYFTDHDEELGKVVTEGRRREFRHFRAFEDPEARETIPDPQDPCDLRAEQARLGRGDQGASRRGPATASHLIALRRSHPAMASPSADGHEATALDEDTIGLLREGPRGDRMLLVARLRGEGEAGLGGRFAEEEGITGRWEVALTTEDPSFVDDPQAPEIDLSRPAPAVRFRRPGAVLFKGAASA